MLALPEGGGGGHAYKNILKSHFCPKKVSLKKLYQYCLQCKYILDIIIYNYTICIVSVIENIDIF